MNTIFKCFKMLALCYWIFATFDTFQIVLFCMILCVSLFDCVHIFACDQFKLANKSQRASNQIKSYSMSKTSKCTQTKKKSAYLVLYFAILSNLWSVWDQYFDYIMKPTEDYRTICTSMPFERKKRRRKKKSLKRRPNQFKRIHHQPTTTAICVTI